MEPTSDLRQASLYQPGQYVRSNQKQRGLPTGEPREGGRRLSQQGFMIYEQPVLHNYDHVHGFVDNSGTIFEPQRIHSYCGQTFIVADDSSIDNCSRCLNANISTPTLHDTDPDHIAPVILDTNSHETLTGNTLNENWTPQSSQIRSKSASTFRLLDESMARPSTDSSIKSANMKPSNPDKLEKRETVSSEGGSPTSTSAPVPPIQQGPSWSTAHDILFIATCCLAQFLSLATLAQTVAPLLIIGDYWDIESPGQLAWFTASYSMTLGTFILPSGRLGDIFGHKKIFLLGWLWFSMTSFLAGLSHSWGPIEFSAIRGLQGIGPALLVPNAMALIARTYPIGDKRAFVLSLFGACGPTGFLTGAIFSSIFAQLAWWPWSFWSTSMVATGITFIAYCVVPDSLATGAPGMLIQHFDFFGCITGVTGLILINFSLNQAPLVGWQTPYVYFLLIIGIILTLGFFYIELNMAKHPLVPVRGLQPQAILTLACIAAGWASHGIWIYYLFMFMMHIRGSSALLASAQLIPVAPIGVAFALSTNFLIKKIQVARVMLLAMLFFLVGTIFLAVAPANQTYWALTFISIVVMPGGMNLSFPAGTILLSSSMPREHQGKAASMISTIVNYSIASGLGFAGTVERYVNFDGDHILQGYRGAWYVGIGFSGLGLLISLYFVWILRNPKPSS